MKTLVAEALEVLALVKGMLEVSVLVLLVDVLEVELTVVLVMVLIVLERLVLELLVDVFDVLALLVEVLEGVYGAPNVMLGVETVNVESSCAKMYAMTIVQASHDKCLGGCA